MLSFRGLAWMPSVVFVLLVGPAPAETTWPEWRGPSRDGQIAGHAWPDSLSKDHLTEQWRVELQPIACLDLATGEERWITKPYGKYWSLVANGDKLLALDERGDLYLIRLNPEQFELLDTRKLTENAWAHLAVAGEDVFIRDLAGLTVHRWR